MRMRVSSFVRVGSACSSRLSLIRAAAKPAVSLPLTKGIGEDLVDLLELNLVEQARNG